MEKMEGAATYKNSIYKKQWENLYSQLQQAIPELTKWISFRKELSTLIDKYDNVSLWEDSIWTFVVNFANSEINAGTLLVSHAQF